MKKLIKAIIPLLLAEAVGMSAQCMTTNIKCDIENRQVTVSGTVAPESIITMLLVSGQSESGEVTAENAQEKVFAGAQIKADSNGVYEKTFTFDSKENTGWYYANVFSVTDGEKKLTDFYMPDETIGKKMIEDFDAASWEDMYSLVKKYSVDIPVIAVEVDYYTPYEEEISKLIAAKKGANGFVSNTLLEKSINSAIAEINLKYVQQDKVDEIMQKYAATLGITLDEKYADFKAETAALFISLRDSETSGDTVTAFEKAMALTKLNNSKVSEIQNVINKYNAVLGLDMSAYSKYDPVEISKALYGKNYADTQSLKTDYENRVKELLTSSSVQTGGGGSSGGSGGGSGGSGFKTGTIVVDPTTYMQVVSEKKLPFKDMEDCPWAKESVQSLYARGIIKGVSDNAFEPTAYVKRSEVSKMICKALNTEIIIGDNPFTDVDDKAWYAEFVINAYENNLISGFDGKFEPEENILRRDIALIIARALKNEGIAMLDGTEFSDIGDADRYAEKAIGMLAAYGIVNGYSDNKFRPAEYVTRAESAKMIYNMMRVIENE